MAADKIQKIQSFEGLIVAPFTAFDSKGEVRLDIIPKYVDFLESQGVTGAFVNGTTGEGVSLTVRERKAIAEAWVKAGKGRCKVIIIHIGANSIKDAQELAAHAEQIGATGIASLPPFFYKPGSHDHLIAYFKAIAEAAPTLPLMMYHIPSYNGVEVDLSEFLPKARKAIPTFCGAKFTSTDIRELLRCHSLPGEPFTIFSGYDEVLLSSLASGGKSAVGASYNFMAPLGLQILKAFKNGDIEGARKIQSRILHAIDKIASHGQGISCFKTVMNILGPLDFGEPRLPLLALSPQAKSELSADLKKLNTEEWRKV